MDTFQLSDSDDEEYYTELSEDEEEEQPAARSTDIRTAFGTEEGFRQEFRLYPELDEEARLFDGEVSAELFPGMYLFRATRAPR